MRRTVLTATALLAAGGLALPASASHRPPITKTYEASALPGVLMTAYCDGVPTTHDKHLEPFKAPAAGTLKVSMTGHAGDWDAMLLDAGGGTLVMSATVGPGDESYAYKIKKPGDFTVMSCNVVGGPSATVTYTFTFAA